MVDPYATSLAGLTLAVSRERFLLEEPVSNSVLSLGPALSAAGVSRPLAFGETEGFSTAPDSMEVTWKPLEGVQVSLCLRHEGGERFRLEYRFTNASDRTVPLLALHPLHIAPEGPGALALGMHDLRTLGSRRPGRPARLAKLQGTPVFNGDFGAWFSANGSPMLLLGPLEGGPVRFVVEGARGKLLSLRIDCAENSALPPGACVAGAFLLVIGNTRIQDALPAWARRSGRTALAEAFAGLDPGGEIVEEIEEIEEEAPVVEPEPGPAPEPVTEPETDGQDPEAGSAPAEAGPESGPETEAAAQADSVAGTEPSPAPGSGRHFRCATFRRALRANEGRWPRREAGRKYAPAAPLQPPRMRKPSPQEQV